MSGLDEITKKLQLFKRRYYVRKSLIGFIGFLLINLTSFLFLSSLEHQFWLGITGRAILFFGFLTLLAVTGYLLLVSPVLQLLRLRDGLSDDAAANEISKYFPEIQDKLINTLQLSRQVENDMLIAAIDKKSADLRRVTFVKAVDFSSVKKYVYGLALLLTAFLFVSFINPSLLIESSNRIVNYEKEFAPNAPFQFELRTDLLRAFRGEDFVIKMQLDGSQLPEYVWVYTNGRKEARSIKLLDDNFSFTLPKIQSDVRIQFEAAGFRSTTYKIEVFDRPDLVSMLIRITEPIHTGGKRRTVENTGDLTLLEGSSVIWEVQTLASDSLQFVFNKQTLEDIQDTDSRYVVEQQVFEDGAYSINLFNEFSKNTSDLNYSVEMIKDEYPKIEAQFFPDSITYEFITLAGSISDDYGFTGLFINYRIGSKGKYSTIPLEIESKSGSQSYFANWSLDSLSLLSGQSLEVFMSVQDNDGVNGPKVANSRPFVIKTPDSKEINTMIADKQDNVEDHLTDAEARAEEIAKRLEEIEERLKSQQQFEWQEKKLLNDVLEDREKLTEEIEQLKKEHSELLKSNDRFQQQSNELQEKNQKMQELLDQLMDEETRKLYEKLKELMKENASSDQISQQLEELKKSEQNLERDLERALELFKRLKMESALEQSMQQLDSLSEQQNNLSEQLPNKEAQQDINEAFNEFRDQMEHVEKLNQQLKRPEALQDFELEERQIAKELREIMEQMESDQSEQGQKEVDSSENTSKENSNTNQGKDKNQSDIQRQQQNAAKKMKELSQKLTNMQGGMQMEMMQANLDQLRDILDNLVKLSFNQEEIMLEMRAVDQSDPRFLELSQNQLKLKDDAKVIQDSLLSLASKVVQISSYVTREVESINKNIDQTIELLKDRNRVQALSSQQFAMTSINNLALLLDDTMQQMQMSMSEAMGNGNSQDKQQQGLPDLQELQNQLGEQINELKGSGKSGRELSEELARFAAEQEMIRRRMEMLKEAQDGKPGGGFGGDELKRAIDLMEQNEIDLVNKRITRQLINRQKQIQTRMLEAEKAQRNQEMDEEREADKAKIISREIPPGFEKYLELKRKELELLKTIPLELNPFYKKEVNDYFRRLSSDEKND